METVSFVLMFRQCFKVGSINPAWTSTVELQQKDREMLELLQERVSLFCELAEVTSGQDLYPPVTRYMFRADTPQAPRAEKNLQDAAAEGDSPNTRHVAPGS